jgi:hypothetical protein
MAAEDRFASLFQLFEDPNRNRESTLDISGIPNAQVYTNLVQTLTDCCELSSKKISLTTADPIGDYEDWLDEDNLELSSDQLPSYEQIQKEDVVNSSSQNWSPNSKFNTLSQMMDVLLLREKEKVRNDEAIIETQIQLDELMASACSNLIFNNFGDSTVDEDYNQTTEKIIGNLVACAAAKSDTCSDKQKFLSKLSYAVPCSPTLKRNQRKTSLPSNSVTEFDKKVFTS